jgi:hypothetical protein
LAQAAQPNSPAGPPLLPFPFLFRSGADRRAPPVSPYSPSFLSSSPLPRRPPPHAAESAQLPPLPLPFFPPRACQLSQVTALDQLGPFPLSLHRAVMAAGHQWQAAAAPSPSRFAFLSSGPFKLAHAPLGSPFASATHTRTSPSSIPTAPPPRFPPPPSIRRRR